MPLLEGHSNEVVNSNIRELRKGGYEHKQAIAAALHNANKSPSSNSIKKDKGKNVR